MLSKTKSRYSSGKRIVILTTLYLVFCITLYADSAVDSTRSMNEDHLTAIKNAFSGGDPVASHYWLKFINHDPTKDDSTEFYYGKGDFDDFNADGYDVLKLET